MGCGVFREPGKSAGEVDLWTSHTNSHTGRLRRNYKCRKSLSCHAPRRNRTYNLVIKSHLLCQLS
jgi:hypothetical protein